MPRTTDNPLDRYMRFRCTEREGERLVRMAESQSLTFSEYARQQLLQARRRGKSRALILEAPVRPEVAAEARKLAFEIHKVGVNLNQIAKAMHSFHRPPPPELAQLVAEIRQYVRKAHQLPKDLAP
jgi:hypothetical protein